MIISVTVHQGIPMREGWRQRIEVGAVEVSGGVIGMRNVFVAVEIAVIVPRQQS